MGFKSMKEKAAGAGKTAGRTDKVAATVTDEIKVVVDKFIKAKAAIAAATTEKEAMAQLIRDCVLPQQDAAAYAGEYHQTYTVAGNEGQAQYTSTDAFNPPQDEPTLEELRKICGKLYDEFFGTKDTISLKPAVAADQDKLRRIEAACKKDGMDVDDLFDMTVKVVAKDDLDKNQYKLPPEKLVVFRSLAGQNRPAIK